MKFEIEIYIGFNFKKNVNFLTIAIKILPSYGKLNFSMYMNWHHCHKISLSIFQEVFEKRVFIIYWLTDNIIFLFGETIQGFVINLLRELLE